ncbi:MAG: TonB-dependent outer membrane protein SusC/RagA [Gemmatimonadetes bacterium]|nr:TonB-dependent outer membrane protein SusC/RagA [Gemmatimonadota bacterium]
MRLAAPRTRAIGLGALIPIVLALTTHRALAQTASIAGRVTALESGLPLADARVSVVGAMIATNTDAQGRYTLRAVANGRAEVRVQHVGYAEQVRAVTVGASGAITQDFELKHVIVQLQDVVTTATGVQRKVELGNAVATLGDVSKRVGETSVTNAADLLVAKTPGMTVISGNNTGAPPMIRIRGLNSLSLNNAPIFVIDGVRMNVGANGTGTTSAATSYLTGLDPTEVEDIEIVKGPSAATLYGTDAANGVVVITTKRGKAGNTRWAWNAEAGVVDDRNQYLTAYALLGHTASASSARCLLIQVAAKSCAVDSSTSLNIMNTDSLSPLSYGHRNQYGMQVSGGNDAVRYFISGDMQNEIGPYKMPGFSVSRLDSIGVGIRDEWMYPEALQQQNLRANITATLTPKFDLTATAGYVKTDERVPGANNGFFSVEYQSMTSPGFTHPGPGYTARGQLGEDLHGYNGYVPSEMNQLLTQYGVQRLIGSFNANWRPTSWMENQGTMGVDAAGRSDLSLCRYGECPVQGTIRQGRSSVSHTNDRQFSAKIVSTSTWQARPWAALKTTFGSDYINAENDASVATGDILPPGATVPQAGAIPTVNGTLATAVKTLGVYAQEQVGLRDRLFLIAAVRSDQNSAFGSNFQRVLYPKLSLSWLISDEAFFPKLSFLDQFRVRSAYGASGVQPGSTSSLVTYRTLTVNTTNNLTSTSGTDTPGLRANSLGNANLKPETSAEWEVGIDTRGLSSRVNLELTYFSKQTHDALIQQPIAPSAAPSNTTVLKNLGSIKNAGIEAVLTANVFDRRDLAWDATIAASHLGNRIVSLGNDATGQPNKTVGTGANRDSIGQSVNGWFYRPYTYADVNGDGVLSTDEVQVAATFAYWGYSIPRDIISVQNGIEVLRRKVRFNFLFDYRGGFSVLNQTANIQCAQSNSCPGASDPHASLAQQAANIATRNANPTSAAGFLQSGQFWRFREASATVTLPNAIAGRLRAQNARVTFAGRNLHIWTRYTGPDPESNYATTGDVQNTYSTSGLRSYFTARLSLNY